MTPQVNGLPRLFSSKPGEDFGQQHHLSHPIIQDGACSPESPTSSWTSGMTVNAAAAQEFCAGKQARLMTSSRKKRVFSPTFVMQCFPTMQENVALDHYPIILGSSYLFTFAAERWTRLDSNEDKMFMHRSHLLSISVSPPLWTPIYIIRDQF